MVGMKLMLLSSFLCIQRIYAYCVRNNLTDGSSFTASQLDSNAFFWSRFTKHMEMGASNCCNYGNTDCSPNGKTDDVALFSIQFYFSNKQDPLKYTKCTIGGSLIIHGTQDAFNVECVDANGVSGEAPLENTKEALYDHEEECIE